MRGYGIDPFCKLLAMRLSNLAAAKYHHLHRHSVLLSKPIQLTVDPTNACQLQCPACVHTANKAYAALFDWPRSTLPLSTYQDFLSQFGVFGFCATLYSYGEPLLNRQFTDFVRESKQYLLFTLVSTNLSMPKLDAGGIVASGLDRMVLSIDGTTQNTYERYRRRGDLGLVLDNVRRLVAAKRNSRSATPYLVWQFLTFEHNQHQVEDAISMARELGINEVRIETPFSPHEDDPGIRSVSSRHQGTYRLSRWNGRWCSSTQRKAVAERAAQIDTAFKYSWQERLLSAAAEADSEIPNRGTCEWLYNNITLDGLQGSCLAAWRRTRTKSTWFFSILMVQVCIRRTRSTHQWPHLHVRLLRVRNCMRPLREMLIQANAPFAPAVRNSLHPRISSQTLPTTCEHSMNDVW